MRRLYRWFLKRIRELDLLPEYFEAVGHHWQNVLWGASMPFVAWGLWTLLGNPPHWVNVMAVLVGVFLAAYYVWRTDHERFLPRLDIANNPRIQATPVMTSMGYDTHEQLVYLQIVRKCVTDSPVNQCQGYLLRVSTVVEEEWEETALNETLPLEWSLRKEPALTLYPGIEQRLNVCFWGSEKGITPATTTLPLRWHSIVNCSGIFKFDIRVISADSAPVDAFVVVTLDNREWGDPLVVVSTTSPPLASCTRRAPLAAS